jgi:hypothetical protein
MKPQIKTIQKDGEIHKLFFSNTSDTTKHIQDERKRKEKRKEKRVLRTRLLRSKWSCQCPI